MRQFGPFLPLIFILVLFSGCEKIRYKYLPTAPDTVIVRDTVIVDDDDNKHRPGRDR